MKINCFSGTFWFNIVDNHQEILKVLSTSLKDEFPSFNVLNETDNLLVPIITGFNNSASIAFSKINLQYTMEKVTMENFDLFKERILKLFDILTTNNIEVLHSAIYLNGEVVEDDALNGIIKNTVNSKVSSDDLVDVTLKLGKKHEDIFYKIITILNKKQIKVSTKGAMLPLPLVSWYGAYTEHELIEFSYEINDKYSFDTTKDYHTTEFYLNKMLYLLENDAIDDFNNLIKNGEY